MTNFAMLTLGAMAAVAVLATNVVNRRRHVVVTARTHDYAIAGMVVVILAVLLILPAQAQELGGATSDTLYLPQVSWTFPMWFTDAELTQAQIDAGYDVEVASMHTNCLLDVTAVPPYLIRYSECQQFWVDGVATEGTSHYILWRKYGNNVVTGVEIGQ